MEKIMEEELYADFALLFRTLHASRMPEEAGQGEDAVIEHYHQDSLASGTRIREKLSEAVESSIKTLANGFLQHPKNAAFIAKVESGQITAQDYYLHLLRLIYRILFIIVIEERKLIYPEKREEQLTKYRNIYFQFYSLERIRKLVESNAWVEEDKIDLWKGLVTTFMLFENEHYGKKLGIDPLGSGLFSSNAIGMLPDLQLTNRELLAVIRSLTTFENDQKQTVRVNYSDLDVEEFGSVYEGLLEYDPKVENTLGKWHFTFVVGDGRSSSGSHYTPEELVKPLIKHSLDYVIQDKLKEADPEQALLSIKVCDVACGSGHILLSAARRIATELACFREKAEQPSPPFFRVALREVIKSCIYGVDLNPLAVELCKVALWLEAHNPGEPLNFLDHHIKCGNAIVGLAHIEELRNGIASEAFKSLPGDDKDASAELRKQNDKERKNRAGSVQFNQIMDRVVRENLQPILSRLDVLTALPENTPQEIAAKAAAYQELIKSKTWWRLKQLADIQVAQFFVAKDGVNEFITEGPFYQYLLGNQAIQSRAAAKAAGVATEKRFFHWFLEFPEVITKGGFDCILGNPPFLGGQKLTGTYGNYFAEYLKYEFAPIGLVDLVTYFFRRNYTLIKKNGFISLISTNTIAQGDARQDGLAQILKADGVINHAVRSMRWPGLAAVEVSLVTVHKGAWSGNLVLDQKEVDQISSYLDSQELFGDPFSLASNTNKSFQGSIPLGDGFVLSIEEAENLLSRSRGYKDVVFSYLNGDDLNNQVDQSASRMVINFFNWPERRFTSLEWQNVSTEGKNNINERLVRNASVEKAPPWFGGKVALDYPIAFQRVEELVKPYRLKQKRDIRSKYWWKYGEQASKLYDTIDTLERVLVVAKNTKHLAFYFAENG
ncbi:MAG: N-6 DNA methylase, partial [Imperialibacter sp.]